MGSSAAISCTPKAAFVSGKIPRVGGSSQERTPNPTTEEPTAEASLVSAGVEARKFGLDDHKGAPTPTRKAVSARRNRCPTHRPTPDRPVASSGLACGVGLEPLLNAAMTT